FSCSNCRFSRGRRIVSGRFGEDVLCIRMNERQYGGSLRPGNELRRVHLHSSFQSSFSAARSRSVPSFRVIQMVERETVAQCDVIPSN
ncbi:hypothetical protein PMAYCL1PPCAC_13679, partial [Pristionchus mayeri]